MSPLEDASKEKEEKYDESVVKFVSDIRSGKLKGSYNIAISTLTLLDQMISSSQDATALDLLSAVRAAGRQLSRALPQEPVAANMVRRVLRVIRDEYSAQANQSGESAGEGLTRLVSAAPARRATLGSHAAALRAPVREHVHEIIAELESSHSALCGTAREQLQGDGGELLLAMGAGRSLEGFLKAAGGCRLVLVEGADVAKSHAMAVRLSRFGVDVTLVGNAAVAAVMPRVNKVVLSCLSALAGGAARCAAGAHALTAAAKLYAVPVLVLAPLYKLCPRPALDERNAHALRSPHQALPYSLLATQLAHAAAPAHDLVPPDHITLFVTNIGGSSPSYMYRLLSELYDPNDYEL